MINKAWLATTTLETQTQETPDTNAISAEIWMTTETLMAKEGFQFEFINFTGYKSGYVRLKFNWVFTE